MYKDIKEIKVKDCPKHSYVSNEKELSKILTDSQAKYKVVHYPLRTKAGVMKSQEDEFFVECLDTDAELVDVFRNCQATTMINGIAMFYSMQVPFDINSLVIFCKRAGLVTLASNVDSKEEECFASIYVSNRNLVSDTLPWERAGITPFEEERETFYSLWGDGTTQTTQTNQTENFVELSKEYGINLQKLLEHLNDANNHYDGEFITVNDCSFEGGKWSKFSTRYDIKFQFNTEKEWGVSCDKSDDEVMEYGDFDLCFWNLNPHSTVEELVEAIEVCISECNEGSNVSVL